MSVEDFEVDDLGEAEEISVDIGNTDVIDLDDGSTLVPDPDAVAGTMQGAFDDNLALILPDEKLNRIASEFCDLIEKDIEARKERDMQYEEGIRRTGLSNDAPGGAQFENSSKVVHPVLAEACVDYASATIKEIFPPEGPVKMQFLSSGQDPELLEKAENKRDFLNWQLTEEIVEYRTELEVLLTQQPLGGSQYMKFWYDPGFKRIRCEFVPIDKLYLPFSASSFLVAKRFTISSDLTEYEISSRMKSGLYKQVHLTGSGLYPEESASEEASHRIEGKESSSDNIDGLREIYEVHAFYDIEDTGEAPYIITIDRTDEKILSIYRNWEESDSLRKRVEWVVEFPFIPWRGAYGIGLIHLIGSLSAAATGSLRALLDSALINNFPGAIKLKGGHTSGQNITVGPTEIVELDAPANVDDIRKLIMPMPFNPPSAVLLQLLGIVVETAKNVVSTAEEKISDASNQMPVGTAMALIEQGSKVFSVIHSRQHLSQKRCLKIIQRLDAKYYDPEVQMAAFGKILVPQEDFLNVGNVVPVSDPNIFSESQRFAQVQSILQMAQDQTVQWNKQAIYKRVLRLMHVEAPQEFLPDPPVPVSADPVTEIVAAMSGQQIQAQQGMDHMEHISEQLSYLLDPIFGAANESLNNTGFQTILNDVYQHLLLHYQELKQQAMQQAQQQAMQMMMETISMQMMSAGMNINMVDQQQMQMMIQQQMQNPQVVQQVKQQATMVFNEMKNHLVPYVDAMNQAYELLKEKSKRLQDEAPLDPQSKVALKITELTEQTRLEIANIKTQFDSQKEMLKNQLEEEKLNLDLMVETKIKPYIEQLKGEVEIQKNDADNMQKHITDIKKNDADNDTVLSVNFARNQAELEKTVTLEAMRQESKRAIEEMKMFNQQQMEEMKLQNSQLQEVIKQVLSNVLNKGDENGRSSEE